MEKEEKDSKDYNEWIDKKQKEIYESKRELEKQSYDAIKYMRKTNGKLAKIDEDYGWEIRKRLTSENWDYMIEEMKKLFYIALAKANIPLSDISITEYEDSKLHRVDSWERKDDKDPKSEHVTITKHYKYLLCYQQYCIFANNEFELYAKGIDLILNPKGYWYPKFSMKNMSFHISTEEYELKRKIDNLEIEKKVYIDDKNK